MSTPGFINGIPANLKQSAVETRKLPQRPPLSFIPVKLEDLAQAEESSTVKVKCGEDTESVPRMVPTHGEAFVNVVEKYWSIIRRKGLEPLYRKACEIAKDARTLRDSHD